MLAMPWHFLALPGNFIMAALLTQYYGLNKATYGLLAALPMLSNAVQVLLLPWLARFLTPKDLALGMGWLNIGLWTMLAAVLPFLPEDDAGGLAQLFLVFFVVSSLSQSLLLVGWTSWVRAWVPTKIRGKYFGRRNRWLNLSVMGYLVFAWILFAIAEYELWTYQVLLWVAVVGRYASLIWQHGIRTSVDHLDVVGHGWWTQLQKNLSAPGLTRFVLFAAWTSFWLAFVGPFLPVFSYEALGLPPGHFTFLVILSTASGIFGWWYWGRRVDVYGCLPVLMIGLGLWELSNYFWALLNRDNLWLLYPMWIFGGFVATAYFAASFNILLKLVPSDAKLMGVSLHLALTSVAAAVAAVVAGLLLNRFLTSSEDLLPYRIGFVVKSTAVLAGLILLRGLREPQHPATASFTGAFRTIRQLISAQGASVLGRSG